MEEAIVVGTFSFLGYNLLTRLLEDGVVVHGIDFKDGQDSERVKEEKILAIGRNANFISLEEEEWPQILHPKEGPKVNALFYCLDMFNQQTLTRASQSLEQAIEYCKLHSCPLIFSSSVEVVDHNERQEITEDTPINPVTGKGKMFNSLEEMIQSKCNEEACSYLILRFPTLYGPWQPDSYVYQRAILALEEGKTEQFIENKDEYKGDLLYVGDAVQALLNAKSCSTRNELIHITSGKEGEWEKGLSHILNKTVNRRNKNLVLTNDKAKELLGFTPRVSIEEGIVNQRETNLFISGNGRNRE
ncbi:UDP-glucose 4-epimerase [Bacillus mesophilus]|uniref:NAD(P)-dependent oxidoreductase n=1 Tax=Bacillus mesophilus TaxID=1808955 RepID=A0A6M0Q2M3_9BACI|nr:NAD(P)-dependent oxidoreductase [Bacillus mesophilus]MBM7659773.1 UDP-glucose 4-epimerase [Bacillus mesophilus]NEY70635.1 NAD(P)-dependent oxidoreductase [Bacillus mesophilus]